MTNMPSPRNQSYLEIKPLVAECTEEERILRNSRIILGHPSCYKNNNINKNNSNNNSSNSKNNSNNNKNSNKNAIESNNKNEIESKNKNKKQ